MHGHAVLCPFQAQCARAFRAGGSGGTDESLVTCTPGARMCPWPCPRNRTSVGQQAAVRQQGAAGAAERQSGESVPSQKPVSGGRQHSFSQGRHWFVPEGRPVACSRSDVVPDPTQWYGGTSPARIVLKQAFKPVALPERPFSHTRMRRLPLGGTRGTVCRGPILNIWARVRSSGRARTRETTIPSAETGTSSRLALPTGNKVAKAIGFLPEERGQSAPPDLA